MSRYVSFIIFIALSHEITAYVEALAANYDSVSQPHPQLYVAMVCDNERSVINQFMNEHHQWVSDTDTKSTCVKSKTDILKYCQKVYPKRDVRNIVESTHHFSIDNWCRNDGSKCGDHHIVRPYRCLEGNFESDALLVPQQCIFDHIHKQTQCDDFEFWNGAASKKCFSEGKNLRSFAMLKPCGIGLFSGVEFVCCPKHVAAVNNHLDGQITVDIENKDAEHENEIEDDDDDDSDEDEDKAGYQTKKTVDKSSPEYYFTHFDSAHEHELFKEAQEKLEEIQHEKVTNVMKQWGDLVERYQAMKEKDPKGAEKFKQQTTLRFQKTVKALEDEQAAEKAQIISMHQQRIAASTNLKKKESMNCYVQSLDSKNLKPKKIQKCLQKLVRALEKDRHHTLKHFHHMVQKNMNNDEKMRSEVLTHLNHLHKVYNQSLDMLGKYPKISQQIKESIREFWLDLRSSLASDLPSELIESLSREFDETILDYYKHNVETKVKVKQQQREMEETRKQELRELEDEKKRVEINVGHKVDDFDPETMEDESIEVKPQALDSKLSKEDRDRVSLKLSNYKHHKIDQDEVTFSVRREEIGSSYIALTDNIAVALAFVGVALVVVIIIGVSIVRRRNRRSTPSNQGFIEVDQAVTPEERHVANMQVNGYENPTYRYFEVPN